MKNSSVLFAAIPAAALFLTAMAFSGCESESAASAKITVSPSSATLTTANASVVLSASGGWSYSWSLSNSSIGSLSKTSGKEVLYTASSFSSNMTQVITVTATGLTNSVNSSATIAINQVSNASSTSNTESGSSSNNTSTTSKLAVSPSSATLNGNTPSVRLTASGGSEPYTWSCKDNNLGSLSSKKGNVVFYTAATNSLGKSPAMSQIVTVKDSKNSEDSVLIIQQ